MRDFSGNANLEFYHAIYEELKELDISILVNNAGVLYTDYFKDLPLKEITDTLDVNVTHVSAMSKVFLQKLLTRKKKSALINVSSLTGFAPAAGAAIYHASKGFCTYFTQSLAADMRGKLDVQCLTPGTT